jgi:hypothetical protein
MGRVIDAADLPVARLRAEADREKWGRPKQRRGGKGARLRTGMGRGVEEIAGN